MKKKAVIDMAKCVGCGCCVKVCPLGAVSVPLGIHAVIDPLKCVGCGRCYLSCRDGGHQALRFDAERRQPVLIPQNCVGCHLCLLVCPQNAISSSRKRMRPKE